METYWLTTPEADDCDGVFCVDEDSEIHPVYANEVLGVRPALVLDVSKIHIESGVGNKPQPYVINS
jgi:hypothetical protein